MMYMGSGYVYHCPDCSEATYIALGIGQEHSRESVFYGDDADPPLIKDFSCRRLPQSKVPSPEWRHSRHGTSRKLRPQTLPVPAMQNTESEGLQHDCSERSCMES